ncbi:MAG: hypothetical protein QOF20_865 [Acidimicrobiaceae bacterium]|jgi:hypothetical protein|nr:hypothetical protein [Acidimicrobiaceae bacterium]MDQ1364485.1 hypothetical protein [Acidimicrobiaceae bacterium]MDQ1368512.1 hypothetical protein [Acidimicrobiaceae bacterium]MDQ1379178.1 hypothetical protein [Acidimicrobiaceae bacterium]MDQ1399252.1 hypothetical protein [Acidimicrobiaceae bacterium]
MGFFDKVKEQAEKAKVQAQDLKGKVGEKVDEVQSKRKADELLDDLGRFLYAERIGRPQPGADSEIERIVQELKALEDDGIEILPAAPTPPVSEPATEAPSEPAAAAEPASAPASATAPVPPPTAAPDTPA